MYAWVDEIGSVQVTVLAGFEDTSTTIWRAFAVQSSVELTPAGFDSVKASNIQLHPM
jgi:hypothetical protein